MTGKGQHDDARQAGDALDRVIDAALESALATRPVNLRSQVLARLDEPVDERAARRFFVLRPALMPVAGAILIVIGVAITWKQANTDLRTAGGRPAQATAGTASGPAVRTAPAGGAPKLDATTAGAATVPPAGSVSARPVAGHQVRAAAAEDRIFATGWLAMDAMSRPKVVAADIVIAGDDQPEPALPGAIGGDLGDPIKPLPRLRPIVIQPIVTAPIVDAPPVSTLAAPVSTLSTDEISRGRPDPGKTEGVRP